MTICRILFRKSLAEEDEFGIASKYFEVIESRAQIKPGDFIIPRYSFLPYGDELEKDVLLLGGKLINTYAQHRYVADLYSYYWDLEQYTPRTWFDPSVVLASDCDGPYVLKGATNSRKNLWKTHMFCKSKAELMGTYLNLTNDSLIGTQDICIRQFEKFKTYDYSIITGQPITKEFRVFVYKGQVLAKGYYWSNYPEIIEQYKPDPNEIPDSFLTTVIDKIKNKIPAFVVDVGQLEDGSWRVIELNDLTMSGLSCVNPDELYGNLRNAL